MNGLLRFCSNCSPLFSRSELFSDAGVMTLSAVFTALQIKSKTQKDFFMLTQVNQTFFRQLVTGGLPCTISSGRLSLTWTSKRHLSLSRQMTKVPVTPLFPAKFSLSFPAGSSSRFQTCKFDPEEMSSSRPGTVQNWISSEWKRIWEKLVTTMERESIIIWI